MDMFGGLTKTSSRIAIAAALGMTLGGFAMSATPAKAADLGGDCCADLEERVAELEATTVRKGNKKVSVTLSGWIVKYADFWDDGVEQNVYVGDKHTTLSSHFQLSGSAQIAPGWSGGYTTAVEVRGQSTVGDANQFNDNTSANDNVAGDITSNISVLLSYMWIKSDRWGTFNWGQLSQATDNVALLPDLSGTIIESNAVLFDGAGFFLRPNGRRIPRNSQGLSSLTWGNVVNCLEGGGGIGADCNGYPQNGVRYDSPTWAGFSVSGGWAEDDVWDIAVKYAADWNSVKFSAAAGFTNSTDEGCSSANTANNPTSFPAHCNNAAFLGGGGAPFQDFRHDVDLFQVGASILHVPSGLWAYGLYQHEENQGTDVSVVNNGLLGNPPHFESSGPPDRLFHNGFGRDANDTDVWFVKAGIKKAWLPAGNTVIWGEGGQYLDQFAGLAGLDLCQERGENTSGPGSFPAAGSPFGGGGVCFPHAEQNEHVFMTSSTVNRWGAGIMQEIDSAAMHLWVNWQHLELDADFAGVDPGTTKVKNFNQSFEDLDMFMAGGVIFF
jgi:hypothetical protein